MFRSPRGHRNSQEDKDGNILDHQSVQKLNPSFILSDEMQAICVDQDDENLTKVFIDRNKYVNYKEEGKMALDPYFSDKL